MEDQADLIGHGQRHEIAEADEDEDGGEKGERRTLGVEASSVGHAHALAEDEDQRLAVDGTRVGQEEVGDGDVEERHRGDDGFCRDERHGCGLLRGGIRGLCEGKEAVNMKAESMASQIVFVLSREASRKEWGMSRERIRPSLEKRETEGETVGWSWSDRRERIEKDRGSNRCRF